jgi:hypothetical protein
MKCLLCFKKNHKDPNLREVALEKLAARKAAANALEQPKYRDRASERRILFNQPDAPVPEKDAGPTKKRLVEAPSRPVTPPLPVNPGKDQSNVGNKLLKMMGWKEGTGLGSDGDGRVDPMFVYDVLFIGPRLISPSAKQLSMHRV